MLGLGGAGIYINWCINSQSIALILLLLCRLIDFKKLGYFLKAAYEQGASRKAKLIDEPS